MPLSDEQRAMLRLLAQREQGYDDIAALMGLSVEEVRAKVADALTQIEDEGKPAPDVPPPEPKGPEIDGSDDAKPGADEPAAEAEPEPPKAVPSTPALPKQPSAAPLPPPPPPKPAPPKPAAPKPAAPLSDGTSGGRSSGGGRTVTIPSGGGLWPWIGGGVAIIVIVVLAILLIGGSGGSRSSSSTAATTTAETAADTSAEAQPEGGEPANVGAANSTKPTQAILKPVDGASGSGRAIFLKAKVDGKEQLVLGVVARGLPPTGKGEVYAVCLAQSGKRVLPIASTVVKADGKVGSEVVIPTEVLAFVASGVFDKIYLTRARNSRLGTSLKEAAEAGKAPEYTGEPVLVGTVVGPLVGAALRAEEKAEAEEKGE